MLQIEERMTKVQQLSESWREIKEQKQELAIQFQDLDQQLQSLSRRPAELDPKIALNMLDQAKVRIISYIIISIKLLLLYLSAVICI